MTARDFEEIEGEFLPNRVDYVTEIFYPNGKKRTISMPTNGTSTVFTNTELDQTQCYLGYYGLDEPAFAKTSKSWLGNRIGSSLIAVTISLLIGFWFYRNRAKKK